MICAAFLAAKSCGVSSVEGVIADFAPVLLRSPSRHPAVYTAVQLSASAALAIDEWQMAVQTRPAALIVALGAR
jgi:hypothetical protein